MKSTAEFFAELRGLLLANGDIDAHEQNLLGIFVQSLRNPKRDELLDLAVDFDRLESAAGVTRPELQTGLRWLSNICATLVDGSLPGEDRTLLNRHSVASKILHHLEQHPGSSSGDISGALGYEPNHISNQLKPLRQRRLIERIGVDDHSLAKPDNINADKRFKHYYLTKAGAELLSQSKKALRAVETTPRAFAVTLDAARARSAIFDAMPDISTKSTRTTNIKVSRAAMLAAAE